MHPKPALTSEEDVTATPKRQQKRSSSHRRSNSYYAEDLAVLTTQLYSSKVENEVQKVEVVKSLTMEAKPTQEFCCHHPALNAVVNTPVTAPTSIIESLDIKVPLVGLENAREYFATRKPKKSLLALRSDDDPLIGERKSKIISPKLQR